MSDCEHDERFHLMKAKNGCCACELEAALAEIDSVNDISGCPADQSLVDYVRELQGKVERLQSVVDKFPKNRQGESLVYGDTVYWWEDEQVQTGIWRGIGTDGPSVENIFGELQWPCLDWLCGSPEAAESSGKE